MWGHGERRSKDKFTLETLRSLNDVLVKHAVVTDGNKDALVETFRAMAELLTWGDQHEPAIFDFFVEKRMLAHFVRILVQCAPASSGAAANSPFTTVAVQLLQSLSILVQNTRRETSIYYLFSNNYINDLMELKQFDYGVDEEVLAWYISFLKAISLRLNDATIQFFVSDAEHGAGGRRNKADAGAGGSSAAPPVPAAFPLYSQVIRYVQHADSMVRAAARSATLNVFRVDDPAARAFVLAGPEHGYFGSLAASLLEQSVALSELLTAPAPERWAVLAGAVDKLGDLLCYCNDVLDLDIDGISTAMTGAMWQGLVEPLMAAIRDEPDVDAAAAASGLTVKPATALYVLSRLCHSLTYRPLLTALTDALLSVPRGAGAENRQRHSILRLLAARDDRGDAVGALCLLCVLANSRYADDATLDAAGLLPQRRRTKLRLMAALTASPPAKGAPIPYAAATGADDAAAADGSSEAEEQHDAAATDAALPLLRAESGSAPLCDDATSRAARQEVVAAAVAFVTACGAAHSHADLQALSYATWVLRELCEPQPSSSAAASASADAAAAVVASPAGCLIDAEQAQVLQAAAQSAAAALVSEYLQGPWGDAVAPLLCAQWTLATRVGEAPALGDEHTAALLFSSAVRRGAAAASAPANGDAVAAPAPRSAVAGATAPAAERALLAVRRFVVLHGACTKLLGWQLAPEPPLAAPPEGAVRAADELREGAAAPPSDAQGVLCRVAFERGKERRVLLNVAVCAVASAAPSAAAAGSSAASSSCMTAMLVLTEAARSSGAGAEPADDAAQSCGGGVVFAVAPASGAEPYADASHRKWLHLRVRPSVGTLMSCAALPPAPGGPPWAPGWGPPPSLSAARRLQDGHWTLAFGSDELCQEALGLVVEQTLRLRAICAAVLLPLQQQP